MAMVLSLSAQAQDKDNYFSLSVGTDIRNAITGSAPTKNVPAWDITLDAHAVTENIDFGIGYEMFPTLSFTRKYVALGYHIPICYVANTDIKFSIQPSLEWSNIWRGRIDNEQNTERTYSTPSLNINWNWDLSKHFAIQIATNILPRPDLRVIYNESHNRVIFSNGAKGVFKF